MEMINNFLGLVEGKFVVASIFMIFIFLIISFLIYLVTVSFTNRKEAVGVKLPDIDANGELIKENSMFINNDEVTVELIDSTDDEIYNENIKDNNNEFLTSLALETGSFVSDDENNFKLNMPEVGEIDYEQIKEEKRLEKENQILEKENKIIGHLREVAIADNDEDIEIIEMEISDSDKK